MKDGTRQVETYWGQDDGGLPRLASTDTYRMDYVHAGRRFHGHKCCLDAGLPHLV